MPLGHDRGRVALNMKLIRLLSVIFNLTLVIVGITLLAISSYVVNDPKMQQLRPLLSRDLSSTDFQSLSSIEKLSIVLIIIGSVLSTLGFLGCCGATKAFRSLHILYGIIIGGVILTEIILAIVYSIYLTRFKSELIIKLQDSIEKYYVGIPISNNTEINSISVSWDFAQFNLQCCGAISKHDYLRAKNWNRIHKSLTVPFTCCSFDGEKNWIELPTNMTEVNTCAITGLNAYSQGCYDRFVDILATYKKNIIIGGTIVGIIEVLTFFFSILLHRKGD